MFSTEPRCGGRKSLKHQAPNAPFYAFHITWAYDEMEYLGGALMLRQLFLLLALLFSGLSYAYTPQVGDKALYDYFIQDPDMNTQGTYEWEVVEVQDNTFKIKFTFRLPGYEAELFQFYPIDIFGTDEDITQLLDNCGAWNGEIEYLDLANGKVKVCTYPSGYSSKTSIGLGVPGGLIKSDVWNGDNHNIKILREFISAGSKGSKH